MKKFLLSLAVLLAGVAVAQKQYKAVDMLTKIPDGESFLLAADPDGNSFLTTDGSKNRTRFADDNSLIIFEATGEQTADGDDLYAIKFEATGEYIEDQLITDGMDSSDMLYYKLPYFTTTTDIGSATKWTILPAATRYKAVKGDAGWERNWRTYTGQGTGTDTEESTGNKVCYEGAFIIMRDKLTQGGADPVYLEAQSDYTFFAPWGNNDWYLFTYEEKSADDLLQEWWDVNYPEGPEELQVGNRIIGQYDEESVAGLIEAYEAYTLWLTDGEGDAAEILAQSKAAQEALKINEMKEGYYYVVSKRQFWAAYDDNGVMRGLRDYQVPTDEETGETTVTLESSKYIWYFTPVAEKENTYIVKNFGTSRYVTTSAHSDDTGIKTGEFAKAVDYTVAYHPNYPGTVMLYNLNDKGEMTCAWNIFSGNGGVIGNWMNGGHPENDEGNFFYLYGVEEDKVKAIEPEVVQHELNSRLKTLLEEATASYSLGIAYEPEAACTKDDNFASHGYLTYEKDEEGNAITDEEGNVVSNLKIVANDGVSAIHPSDGSGSVVGILDGDANSFTHTYWRGTTYPHFFEVDLGEGKSLDAIAVKLMRRTQTSEHNASFGFGEVKVFGRNSVEEEWVRVANLAMTYDINLYARDENGEIAVDEEGNPVLASWNEGGEYSDSGEGYVGIGATGLGAKYRYLRLQHWKTLHDDYKRENTYFSASEMALFGATYAPEKSLNRAVPADVLTAFETEMAKSKVELNAGLGTEAQILALQNAYDAYLENYPHPELLRDAIAAAKQIAENLPIDNAAVGYYPQSALNTYKAVIAEVESTMADVMTVEMIDAELAKLETAKSKLMKSLNMFTSGYYQVKIGGGFHEEALMHSSRVAANTENVKALCAEFAKQTGNVDEGLVDDENYINSIASVWHIEVGIDNKVAIRSLANGLYLQPCYANNYRVQMTGKKAWFDVQADALRNGGLFNFIVGTDSTSTTKGRPLYANIATNTSMRNGYLISWYEALETNNSTFKLEEVDLADFGYGQNTFVLGNNKTQFFTLPYDAVMYGQNAKVCEVVGYYEDPETEEKAVYFKNIQEDGAVIEGGKPYLVQTDSEVDKLTVQFEEPVASKSFFYTYTPQEFNGLRGTIFSEDVNSGFGVLNIAGRIIPTEKGSYGKEVLTTIAPMSGYIVPSKLPVLNAAPEGEEYVKIVSLVDLKDNVESTPITTPQPNYSCILKDGVVYSATTDKEVTGVTYTRTLPNLYWNALYLPFEVPYEEVVGRYNVAYINAIRSYDRDEDGALDDLEMEVVKIKAGTLKANYPYLIQAKTEADRNVSISVSDATLYAAEENSIDCSTVYQKYEVTGIYDVKTSAELEGKLAISIDGAWQPLLAGSQLNPYRLYLSITNRNDSPVKVSPAALSRVRIVEKGQYTGIDSVDSAPAENVFYDLSGRRVMQPVKGGVYIQNGKKVVR